MATTPRLTPVVLGVVVISVVIFFVWQRRGDSDAPGLRDSDVGERADANVDGVESLEGTAESKPLVAGTELEPEIDDPSDLIPLDVPEEPTNELRPQFGDQLLRAAQVNGTGTPRQACIEWGRLLALALEDEASDHERAVAYLNVEDACARDFETPTRSPHELRMAHEALVRLARDDPKSQASLDRFVAKHPEFKDARSVFVVINQHADGTSVTLDGDPTCTEPCTLAIPVDGEPHHIGFAGPGGEASVTWRPSTSDAPLPEIPPLAG